MSIVFITEKPSVAAEYRSVLKLKDSSKSKGYYEDYSPVMNSNVIITWAVGHLVSLCTPDKQNPDWAGNWSKSKLPMIPENYKYAPLAGTKDQYDVVKSLYTREDIDCIYYAGDSGREGIYIQALIRNQIFKKPPKCDEKVVWISSFSETAILEGIKTAKPYSAYQNMVNSGYARAISDWLIGMNFTQGFTLTSNKLINTGRVITPTLAMIVNRQNEIDNFKKTFFYGVQTDNGITWKAVKGSKFFESDLLYNENGFLKKDDADKLTTECNQDKKLTVADVKVKETPEYAPYLFSLADLQTFCSKAFHYSPAKTLEIAQTLYEAKFTTYPRTDSKFLDTKTQKDLASHGYNIPNRYVNDKKEELTVLTTGEDDKNIICTIAAILETSLTGEGDEGMDRVTHIILEALKLVQTSKSIAGLKLATEMLKGVAEKAGLLDDDDNDVDEEEDCGDCELMKVCNNEQAIAYRKAHGIPRPKKGKGGKVDVN